MVGLSKKVKPRSKHTFIDIDATKFGYQTVNICFVNNIYLSTDIDTKDRKCGINSNENTIYNISNDKDKLKDIGHPSVFNNEKPLHLIVGSKKTLISKNK